MMNKMPCDKKKTKPLIELWRSNKKRIDDALSVVGSKLINIAVITLFVLFYLGSVIYVFWPSSPSSHSSEQSENNTSSSSESLVQNSKHNHVKIYSNPSILSANLLAILKAISSDFRLMSSTNA